MARIAIGGWQHETNTFATVKADFAAFESADEWPGMNQGQAMIDAVKQVHLPIAGAISALNQPRPDGGKHEIVPLMWCSAMPCAYVTEDAFERICENMLGLLRRALPVDGIYFDLHGAMVCEHLQDGEGAFLARVRKLVGNQVPVFVSLDLHANVTQSMVDHANVLDIYRTYPHIDMAETGYRVAGLLIDYLKNRRPPYKSFYKSFRQIDFLIPLNAGCTLIKPCKMIYRALPKLITEKVSSLSFACGFHLSDIFDAGPAVVGYGNNQTEVNNAVQALADLIHDNKQKFYEKIWPVAQGMVQAKRAFKHHGATVVLADTQDNPGGGGAGDTTGVLQAMIEHNLENAALGVINDVDVATIAHQVGIGGRFIAQLGGKTDPGQSQFQCEVEVRNLSDGRFTATGPMYKGANMELGLCAWLSISGIAVVVCCKAVQTADQAHFRHLGIEPGKRDYIALKSSVHFRNDFEKLASKIFIVSAPGVVHADPATLRYKNIRQNIRRAIESGGALRA
ncbi:M81 family metallopeptidase [Candidatus Spongiihabitans sp.]|uniref:M81 family metallopeptidase n=1 Tax=Candidatus Spongiihabitans sp. TaxID=3101308 RepID=UPI003C6F35DB